jgi:hypothetical protein
MVHAMSVLHTVVTIVHLAKTAVVTRAVQSVLHTVAMIARLAATVRHMATAMTVLHAKTAVVTRVVLSVLHTVAQVQLPVVATAVK